MRFSMSVCVCVCVCVYVCHPLTPTGGVVPFWLLALALLSLTGETPDHFHGGDARPKRCEVLELATFRSLVKERARDLIIAHTFQDISIYGRPASVATARQVGVSPAGFKLVAVKPRARGAVN